MSSGANLPKPHPTPSEGSATRDSAGEFALRFPQLDREIPARAGETVFHAARRAGLRIVGACGGRGICGTCMVHIVEGEVDYHPEQPRLADPGGRLPKWIRACQTQVRSDCTIDVAPRSLAPVVRAEVSGAHAIELECAPAVHSRDVTVPEASLAQPAADGERLIECLGTIAEIDLFAARELPHALRAGSGRVRVHTRGAEIIAVALESAPTLGLAVDLGTTNVAAFLVDLATGKHLATLGVENPQTGWGADVISRINHAIRSESGKELQTAAVTAINSLAHDLCAAVGAKPTDIVDVTVCGNTAMHHLLLGLPVMQLGRAPFVAAIRQGMDIKARDLAISVGHGAYVHVVPNVAGFVGGDHVMALLATESRWTGPSTSLVMDIGTNTEISIIHRGEIISTSCPSGPALEGGHISCGMRAAEGAIERVGLTEGQITFRVIGRKRPVGLCGSGVLDALAVLHCAGIVDARGRIGGEHPNVIENDGRREALIAPEVTFTQEDVRAVQLAKAAIRAATDLLLEFAGLRETDIERFIIAGTFGTYVDIRSGIAIGLFPDLPLERFAQVGNAAGAGVQRVLSSVRDRQRAREVAVRCRYVELSTTASFQKSFVGRIRFDSNSCTRVIS